MMLRQLKAVFMLMQALLLTAVLDSCLIGKHATLDVDVKTSGTQYCNATALAFSINQSPQNMHRPDDDESIIDLPDRIIKEVYFYIRFIGPLNIPFARLTKASFVPPNYFGKPASASRKRISRIIEKIERSLPYHLETDQLLRDIKPSDAPLAFLFLQSIRATTNTNTNMSDNNDYESFIASASESEAEDSFDNANVNLQSPPLSPLRNHNRRNSEPGGGKLVIANQGSFAAAYDAAARANFSRGIPDALADKSFFEMLTQLNNVIALDPDKPHLFPAGVDFILVKECPDANEEYTYNKLILILQVGVLDTLASISARLSPDGRAIIVDFPAKER